MEEEEACCCCCSHVRGGSARDVDAAVMSGRGGTRPSFCAVEIGEGCAGVCSPHLYVIPVTALVVYSHSCIRQTGMDCSSLRWSQLTAMH